MEERMAGTFTGNPAAGVTSVTETPAPARLTDDEILGIVSPRAPRGGKAVSDATGFGDDGASGADGDGTTGAGDEFANGISSETHVVEPVDAALRANPELEKIIDATPEVRGALDDVAAYKEIFETPAAAREAGKLIADVNRLDALFYSKRPEDHAELARAVAALDRDAFAMLARSMNELAANGPATATNTTLDSETPQDRARVANASPAPKEKTPGRDGTLSDAQREFFYGANAAAVESVVNEIESQVAKLLPEGIAKPARNRVVGEIYRELDTTLRGNRVLTQQIHDAFRSGRLDADHQRAVVGLITARAKQALPHVAKRVMNEWTNTVVTMNQERRERQRNAERRVDIAGSGGTGDGQRRATNSKDIDYRRMSDADILNL
jgi:hypothetical protein